MPKLVTFTMPEAAVKKAAVSGAVATNAAPDKPIPITLRTF